MIIQTLADTVTALAVDNTVLAVDKVVPETPPQADSLLRLVRYFLWFVLLSGVAAIIYAGGRFGWEKWTTGGFESPKIVAGAMVGGIIASSASAILNAVIPS